jgi:hypothetical protein
MKIMETKNLSLSEPKIEIDNVPLAEVEFTNDFRPKCGKIQYPSFRDAQEAINSGKKHRRYLHGQRMNRRMGKKDIRPVRSYKCDECGFWHLTSHPDYNE